MVVAVPVSVGAVAVGVGWLSERETWTPLTVLQADTTTKAPIRPHETGHRRLTGRAYDRSAPPEMAVPGPADRARNRGCTNMFSAGWRAG